MDVEHVVILMQENRSFDHYFGMLHGVRGFGDRFPIPVPSPDTHARTVWTQRDDSPDALAPLVSPFHLDTQQSFALMRVTGTPHTWPDAQLAWDQGSMAAWPTWKHSHAMGYYTQEDLPFQFALANAFTLCDAYHCSLQAGTNPNRVYAWSGGNDPHQLGHGPVIGNLYDNVAYDLQGGYTWTTYPERLQEAGISWQVYQDVEDNYTDNPLAGFRAFRQATKALRERGMSSRSLAQLQQDVEQDALPQVSYIVATAEGSEHPVPSSPAQGAAYTAALLAALGANLQVWRKTVLLLMFDENDGFFDHVPPPATPSYLQWHSDPAQAQLAGASTVSTAGEYHEYPSTEESDLPQLLHRPYGLGPRVPMYVISPWSRGGWVNSQVFDHSSVIRFLEQRFGVMEPNITPWRRAVCGDLTSAFDFSAPDPRPPLDGLPDTAPQALRARALGDTTLPAVPPPALPVQQAGSRPSRALPYVLHVTAADSPEGMALGFHNAGAQAAVFHVYDRLRLNELARRYTVEPDKTLTGTWVLDEARLCDLWVLGPNGFHRHFAGPRADAQVALVYDADHASVALQLQNRGRRNLTFVGSDNAYASGAQRSIVVRPGGSVADSWPVAASGCWYDLSVRIVQYPGYVRRFAGRMETGRDSISDPANGRADAP